MKVCILAAGIGSRMAGVAQTAHKALLPLNNKAIIGRIIEQFPHQEEFVIAVGFQKDQIKDYLAITYPQKHFIFVEVDNFEGPGSGPGYSLFSCRDHLQEPFIFTACDTLILSHLPDYQESWMGVKKVANIENWCSVKVDSQSRVRNIFYKMNIDSDLAFVGIAFVKEYQAFWEGFDRNSSPLEGEVQVNNGLEALISYQLKAVSLEWEDTGNEENYLKLLTKQSSNHTFDGKITDITYHHDSRIIKFFGDQKISRLRFERASAYKGVFANTLQLQGCFYSYEYVQGNLLFDIINADECHKFLNWAERHLWKKLPVNANEFEKNSHFFYHEKTSDRLNSFVERHVFDKQEKGCVINGVFCLTVKELLNQIDGGFYKEGMASTYHGDLHDNNVIVKDDSTYVLIDWRESFGFSSKIGDRYYDLAKFLHTLNFSVEAMKTRKYEFNETGDTITIKHVSSIPCLQAINAFWDFVKKHHYDERRIRIIEAIVFINMSPLYAKDLGTYLYYLGRYSLQKALN